MQFTLTEVCGGPDYGATFLVVFLLSLFVSPAVFWATRAAAPRQFGLDETRPLFASSLSSWVGRALQAVPFLVLIGVAVIGCLFMWGIATSSSELLADMQPDFRQAFHVGLVASVPLFALFILRRRTASLIRV